MILLEFVSYMIVSKSHTSTVRCLRHPIYNDSSTLQVEGHDISELTLGNH